MSTLKLTDVLYGFVLVDRIRAMPEQPASPEQSTEPEIDSIRKTLEQVLPRAYNIFRAIRVAPECQAARWHMSGHALDELTGPAVAYILTLPHQYAGVVFRCRLERSFSVDEAVRCVEIMRDSIEQPRGATREYCDIVDKSGKSRRLDEWLKPVLDLSDPQVVPIMYVRRFQPWVKDDITLIREYGREIASLVNLWGSSLSTLVADSFVESLPPRDSHPFEFGSSFISPVCTVELHPRSVKTAAAHRGVSLDDHHLHEWTYLSAEVLIADFQRKALQDDIERLNRLVSESTEWGAARQWRSLKRLSSTRADILGRLDVYYNIWNTRKEYSDESLLDARRRFRIDALHASLRDRLEQVSDLINARYDAQISTINLWVAVLALVLSGVATAIAFLWGN